MPARYGPGVLYTSNDYLRELQISRYKRLLVEGRDDKEVFLRLLRQFYPDQADTIMIDTAEQLRDVAEACGNRSKVEEICRRADELEKAHNLVGFVDREFREFECDAVLQDHAPWHQTEGRLVWSRGHSVENYLFDFCNFREKVQECIPADSLDASIRLFEQVFPDAVRVACALGLAGYHHSLRRLEPIWKSIGWPCLSIDGGRLCLELDVWSDTLANQRQQECWIVETRTGYEGWWPVVLRADYEIVRWLCHGHIGLSTIWAAFGRCVYDACQSLSPDQRRRRADEALANKADVRFRSVIEQWVRHALQGHLDCPSIIFDMLGLATRVDC